MLARLTARGVDELFVECGPRLAASFLSANLVDELILYVAPIFLGADAPPLAALHGLTAATTGVGSATGSGGVGAAAAAGAAANAGVPARFVFSEQREFPPDLRLILTPRRD